MSTGIFANMINQGTAGVSAAVKTAVEPKAVEVNKKEKVKKVIKEAAPYVIPLAAIPVTALITYKMSNKNIKGLNEQISNLTNELNTIKNSIKDNTTRINEQTQITSKLNSKLLKLALTVAGITGTYQAGKMTAQQEDDVFKKADDRLNKISSDANRAGRGNLLGNKYTDVYAGIPLLTNNDVKSRNVNKYDSAIKRMQDTASKYLYESPSVQKITSEKPVLWSISSEFPPMKEGGLGSVAVALQNNISKLGIDIPTFIPMYEQPGVASFKQIGKNYYYNYKKDQFKLYKAVSFKVDTYQDGKPKTENVDVYFTHIKDENGKDKKLFFIKNDTYFDGTIYQSSAKSEEPEKFAFFSKAVYELAKAVTDRKSVKDLNIYSEALFDQIPPMDGFILNDWQAAPVAALARYKAPLENAYGQLSDDAANKLENINIITIGHNTMYQGSTKNCNNDGQRVEATSNILNTLFDRYAYETVSNALTKASENYPDDEGLKNLDNVLITDINSTNHTNLLNMGICLSNYFCPVSENYAKEIISDDHPDLAGELRWALKQRNEAGSLVGIINGNDFDSLSIEAKKLKIEGDTGLNFETYNKNSDINDIMEARNKNKINFYNNYIVPLSHKNNAADTDERVSEVRKLTSALEFVDPKGNTVLEKLSAEELKQTPVIGCVSRLVSQKGIKVMSDAIKLLYKNWEKDFPGKNKPIFYIAGEDGENGTQRKILENLKTNSLSDEDTKRVIFAHGFAPMPAIASASDFFLLPSIFEPCGLTQSEALAMSTPVIASAVGGIVDTVNRNGKTNGILTDVNKKVSASELYKALKEGLTIYFEQPDKYKNMVKDSIDEDFSWILPGKKGPCFDYLDLVGIDCDKLPEVK